MKKSAFALLLFILSSTTHAQQRKTEVLTLGVFHFNFPNLDAIQTESTNQIDVLDTRYQHEIESIVKKLAAFKPTKIVIERTPAEQPYYDSLLQAYYNGQYQPGRSEEEQLGFRLAKRFGLSRLYCVDEWGDFTPRADSMVFEKDSTLAKQFENYYYSNPDKNKFQHTTLVYKSHGILAELKRLNNPAYQKASLGNYLIGAFKFENTPSDFLGVHFETGRWFNRNLKIFRNIQRIETTDSDRILVIFGADHMNLLNIFFDSSPEYSLVSCSNYLD